MERDIINFQTPDYICEYMANLVPIGNEILEPTPGAGNLVKALQKRGLVNSPFSDFWDHNFGDKKYDYVVMNPPFTPMKEGYKILNRCMELSDNIIALMPWLSIINSKKRLESYTNFGLKRITHLPREVFKGSRVQTCILELERGYNQKTEFKVYG